MLTGFRPHQRASDLYGYSLHEFLQLCKEVNAEPWYVISPVFSQEDFANLTAYLSVVTMTAADINATNEDVVNVTLAENFLAGFSAQYAMTLPAHSLTVLTWTGTSGLSSIPDPLEFPETPVNGTHEKSLTVKNSPTTDGTRTVLGVMPVSGDVQDFQVVFPGEKKALAPGQQLPIPVEFSPVSPGHKSARFRVLSDDPDMPSHDVLLTGKGLGDADNDGTPDSIDAFPNNPNETQDMDNDGLGDNFEQRIIQEAQADRDPLNDWIVSLTDVNGNDDFDGDGASNLMEFLYGTDPSDPNSSVPLGGAHWLTLLTVAMALVMRRTYRLAYAKVGGVPLCTAMPGAYRR